MSAIMEREIEVRNKFVGTWKLVAAEGKGPLMERLGDNPVGMLSYDEAGNMAVQMMNEDRATLPLASDGDYEKALRGYMAYFGSYELDLVERIVSHNILGSIQPGDIGTQFKRHFEFSGEQLILTTMGTIGGEPLAARLTFERQSE